MKLQALALISALLVSTTAQAADLEGPGRFCGYGPIVDLLPGESVTTLTGGIHGGSFRWDGAFGSLEVYGTGWGRPPTGRIVQPKSGDRPARFVQRRQEGKYTIAVWNGETGVARFYSKRPFTARQLKAIGRVTLFNEGEKPTGCDLRTVFSWG